ncbi:MAG: hypothetical protein WC511_06920, partial [Candidatus Pacearchaeota archaeon]
MKIKVPYTLNLLFPIIGWSILCSIFSYILIIVIANFEEPSAERAFLVMTPVFVVVFAFWALLRYGGVGFLTDNNIRLINKNVTLKGIIPGLSTEEIKDTFSALAFVCKGSAINVLASGLSVLVLVLLTEWFNLSSNFEMLIIICGGAIALFFSCAFAAFYCQQSMFPAIKECRRILIERDDKMEKIEYSGIGGKFFFLFFLPFFTILTVLLAVRPFNFNVAIICLVSLGMTFVIDRVLLIYLTNTLKELEIFATELPKGGERA